MVNLPTGTPLPSAPDHGQGRLRKKGLEEGAKRSLLHSAGSFPKHRREQEIPFSKDGAWLLAVLPGAERAVCPSAS